MSKITATETGKIADIVATLADHITDADGLDLTPDVQTAKIQAQALQTSLTKLARLSVSTE